MSDYIPEELMVPIFSRLSPKSLLRFRCISRSWNSLISSSEFISLHTYCNILQKPPAGKIIRYFSLTQRKEIYSIRLIDVLAGIETEFKIGAPFNGIVRYYYRIVGLCNGVLCLSDDLFVSENLLVLWNPMIGRSITLPMSSLENLGNYMLVCGFGYAIKTRDYKVVRMAYARGDGGYLVPPKVEVYALSSGIWKEFDGFIPDNGVIEYFWTQAVVCGKVHWTAYKITGEERRVENLIMVFDLNDEIFQEISLPEILVNEPPTNLTAAECRKSLVVYQYNTRIWSSSCSIWVMKQYGDTESWSMEYNVALNHQQLDHQRFGMILGFHNDTEILLTEISGMLTSYNPETQEKLHLDILGTRYSFYFGTYKESLALLDKGELLPPLYLSSDGTDDNEDEENNADKMEPKRKELLVHFLKHQDVIAVLGARNI
ncbi:F-box/kelch-repeat protein At3g23880-like [Nicotiana tabacum]|uniref:F-box/kelch-repeat protein At3g23880-like n=1 Tax=Nicotiana tabacum TaxID=4097 RepID=A0AC58UF97_TOBAC